MLFWLAAAAHEDGVTSAEPVDVKMHRRTVS